MVDYLNSEQKRYNDVVLNKQDIDIGRLQEIDEEIKQVLIGVNNKDFSFSMDIGDWSYIHNGLKGFRERIPYLLKYQKERDKKKHTTQ